MRRLGCAVASLALLAAIPALVVYLRRNVVPPACRDTRTLALVHASLIRRFGLPVTAHVENIHMLVGGPLAFRFVCEADLLPGPQTGFVRYTSQLAEGGTRHEVTVEILPLLMWEPVR